jgi:hypothetical protein
VTRDRPSLHEAIQAVSSHRLRKHCPDDQCVEQIRGHQCGPATLRAVERPGNRCKRDREHRHREQDHGPASEGEAP